MAVTGLQRVEKEEEIVMSEWLAKVPFPVLIIFGLILVWSLIMMAYSYFKNKTLDGIRQDVYQLFLKAEHRYRKSESGQQKMKWVIQEARKLLPGWLQVLLSEDALEKVAQSWFDAVKDLLDDGKINGSHGGV